MRNGGTSVFAPAALLAVGFGLLIGLGGSWRGFGIIAILAALAFAMIGFRMRTDDDAGWLPRWVLIGFLAKLFSTWARHWMVAVLYGGGDAFRYHLVGTQLAQEWRHTGVPPLTGHGSFGTQVVEAVTGATFALYTPDLLTGFLMFSMLAYGGQLMFYAAFRHWAGPHQLRPYALLILFLPSFVFWPSSLGKDALVFFALGGAAYFASRLLWGLRLRWLVGLTPFLVVLGLIRIHIAALIVIGLVGAALLARSPRGTNGGVLRKLMIIGVFVGAGALVFQLFPDIFGVDLTSTEEIDSFAADVVRRTSERGTVAAGEAVSGPSQVPGAIALVLFRPYLWEAVELQHFFAAAETSLILGLTIWKLPAMVRSWRSWRANGYVVFSTLYTVAFAVAFSVVRNLGIIARQRGQVLAFFLCVIVALGWEESGQRVDAASRLAPSTTHGDPSVGRHEKDPGARPLQSINARFDPPRRDL